jgi:hypothetical protein
MVKQLTFGLALISCVGLVYLSFAQRQLLYAAYSPLGGRSSAVVPRSSL